MQDAITTAKLKLNKMQNTEEMIEMMQTDEERKRFLRAENKVIRESLKKMTGSVGHLVSGLSEK